jgi:hypothetical protein
VVGPFGNRQRLADAVGHPLLAPARQIQLQRLVDPPAPGLAEAGGLQASSYSRPKP